MKATPIPRLELSMEDLKRLIERARPALSEKECEQLKAAVDTLAYLTNLIEDQDTTIRHLRQILFGASTEKTRKVLGEDAENKAKDGNEGGRAVGQGQPASAGAEGGQAQSESPEKPEGVRVPGHGRNGAQAYTEPTRCSWPILR